MPTNWMPREPGADSTGVGDDARQRYLANQKQQQQGLYGRGDQDQRQRFTANRAAMDAKRALYPAAEAPTQGYGGTEMGPGTAQPDGSNLWMNPDYDPARSMYPITPSEGSMYAPPESIYSDAVQSLPMPKPGPGEIFGPAGERPVSSGPFTEDQRADAYHKPFRMDLPSYDGQRTPYDKPVALPSYDGQRTFYDKPSYDSGNDQPLSVPDLPMRDQSYNGSLDDYPLRQQYNQKPMYDPSRTVDPLQKPMYDPSRTADLSQKPMPDFDARARMQQELARRRYLSQQQSQKPIFDRSMISAPTFPEGKYTPDYSSLQEMMQRRYR